MGHPSEAERYRILFDLGSAFAARLELDELVPLVLRSCREVMKVEAVAVLLHDRERDELDFAYVSDKAPEVALRLQPVRFPADRGLAGAVLRTGEGLRSDDVQSDPRFYPAIDRMTGMTTRTMLAAPLTVHEGVIGVIQLVNRLDGAPFTDDELVFLQALAGSIAIAFENARLYAARKAGEERLQVRVGVLQRDLARRDRFGMVGNGAAMRDVFRLMDSAAAAAVTVLIEGETGTGKELVARGIHRGGARSERAFVPVNCAALPESLLESTLFGHRRGAFTGATHDQRGLFEAASGGTIFLDEVGEMPAPMQAKLLRVLEDHAVVPVGETTPRKVDVRVIAATNRDLRAEVAAGRFRDDLYYRLAVFPIRLPTLDARREDVPELVARIVVRLAEEQGKEPPELHPDALARLRVCPWPGNVRELENELERALTLAGTAGTITTAHLSPRVLGVADDALEPGRARPPVGDALLPLRDARADFEASYIARVLESHGGNVSRTAQALGLSRAMLHRKMKDYELR